MLNYMGLEVFVLSLFGVLAVFAITRMVRRSFTNGNCSSCSDSRCCNHKK